VEEKTYLTRNAITVTDPPLSLVRTDRWSGRIGYVLQYAWRFWRTVPVRDLADHAPINYARAIFPAD
jgi:hypothetical protein